MEAAMLMQGTYFSTSIKREFSMLDYIEYANVIFHKRAEYEQDFEILSP